MPQAGRQLQVQWVERFKGYADILNVDDKATLSDDMVNTHVEVGRLKGRGGMAKYLSISTAAGSDIIGLFNYRQADGSHILVRLLRADVEVISGGVWTSVEGTALTSVAATTQPQADIIDDTLIFTNGTDLPRKYTGSGNTSSIASGTSPYSKGLVVYVGILFLFDASLTGTFTDVTDGHRLGYFNDDWDGSWDTCAQQYVILDETPGRWLASRVIGRHLFCFKSDGVVKLTHAPSSNTTAIKFNHDLIDGAVGIISPLALWTVGTSKCYYLGTDFVIYEVTESTIKPISHLLLSKLFKDTASLDKLQFVRGMADPTEHRGYFFYDRTGLANQLLNSYLAYNYYTNEFIPGQLGVSINAAVDYKTTDRATQQLIVASPTLVETFDTVAAVNDDGVATSRYYTTGWQKLKEEGWFHGVKLIAKASAGCRLRITVALDGEEDFKYDRWHSLAGGTPSDRVVTLQSTIVPLLAESINVRVDIYHDAITARSEIQKLGLLYQPTGQYDERPDRGVGTNLQGGS